MSTPRYPTDDELIADFIARRGVPRCPTAAVAPTTAVIADADAAMHEARGADPAGDAWRKKHFGWHLYWEGVRAGRIARRRRR